MQEEIVNLASLSYVDVKLDELKEDLGDLPIKIKEIEKRIVDQKTKLKETNGILAEIKNFRATASNRLSSMGEKEQQLTDHQFAVKNNREFDAITKEIESIKVEREKIHTELRGCGVKEENLNRISQEQEAELKAIQEELDSAQEELGNLSDGQDDEMKELIAHRKKYAALISETLLDEYDRIRTFHSDAVVQIRRNSCSGCFSAIPPQKIVEIRSENKGRIFYCENCGRILFAEEVELEIAQII